MPPASNFGAKNSLMIGVPELDVPYSPIGCTRIASMPEFIMSGKR